jgi:acyl-[acyl-carrier-protein]-phospholipid O-acyltransferase / long-chain-fatty-acid--[acyl-carrier-protein] ligase
LARQFELAMTRTTLFSALLKAVANYGKDRVALEDPERQPIAYCRLVLGALVLGKKLIVGTAPGERVGILLPNVQGAVVTFFGFSAYGRVPAMLNFTAGVKNIRAACEVGGLSTIITSRRFVDMGKLEDVVAAIGQGRRVIYLEDIRKLVSSLDKIKGVIDAARAAKVHARYVSSPDAPGVVLFTSGTEGTPKGVVLSHANLVANAYQIYAHGEGLLDPSDIVMNPLPIFHSFGLTAAMLMPLLNGMKVVMYPSPLHYKQVPKLVGETRATILFATDTFLQGYARAADEGDLKTVKYVVAGAERVKDDTRRLWEPYGTTILEGYGCTECAPVLSCNTPLAMKNGTVGKLLPGIEHRLDKVEGIDEGGRLMVRGPNIMLGYLMADRPGEIIKADDGWHDTGDIVVMDDGLVSIRGRAKRFAKLGGEMVSLAAVESMIQGMWPGYNHVVVSLPDAKKGEQLVLVTDNPEADRISMQKQAKAEGFPELWVPRALLVTQAIPVLGSGKVDYVATRELALTNRTLM